MDSQKKVSKQNNLYGINGLVQSDLEIHLRSNENTLITGMKEY